MLPLLPELADLADRQLVIEAVVEDESVKAGIFAQLDEIITDPGLRIGAGELAEPLKLTAGRKRHALVVLD